MVLGLGEASNVRVPRYAVPMWRIVAFQVRFLLIIAPRRVRFEERELVIADADHDWFRIPTKNLFQSKYFAVPLSGCGNIRDVDFYVIDVCGSKHEHLVRFVMIAACLARFRKKQRQTS
jgi:hypothetical protein